MYVSKCLPSSGSFKRITVAENVGNRMLLDLIQSLKNVNPSDKKQEMKNCFSTTYRVFQFRRTPLFGMVCLKYKVVQKIFRNVQKQMIIRSLIDQLIFNLKKLVSEFPCPKLPFFVKWRTIII